MAAASEQSAYLRRVSARVLDQLVADPSRLRKVLFPSSTETVIDDDVLITVNPFVDLMIEPHQFLYRGTPIGAEIVGTGPARAFRPAEVRKIAGALAPISVADIKRTYDEMPGNGSEPPQSEVVEAYEALRDFIMTTAQAEAGVIIYVG